MTSALRPVLRWEHWNSASMSPPFHVLNFDDATIGWVRRAEDGEGWTGGLYYGRSPSRTLPTLIGAKRYVGRQARAKYGRSRAGSTSSNDQGGEHEEGDPSESMAG